MCHIFSLYSEKHDKRPNARDIRTQGPLAFQERSMALFSLLFHQDKKFCASWPVCHTFSPYFEKQDRKPNARDIRTQGPLAFQERSMALFGLLFHQDKILYLPACVPYTLAHISKNKTEGPMPVISGRKDH